MAPGDRVLWCGRATLAVGHGAAGRMRAGAVVVRSSPSARAPRWPHLVEDARPALARPIPRGGAGTGMPWLTMGRVGSRRARRPARRRRLLPLLDPHDDARSSSIRRAPPVNPRARCTRMDLLPGRRGRSSVPGSGCRRPTALVPAPLPRPRLVRRTFGTLAAGGFACSSSTASTRTPCSADRAPRAPCSLVCPPCTTAWPLRTGAGSWRHCASACRVRHRWPPNCGASMARRGTGPGTLWHDRDPLTLSNPLVGERRPGAVGRPLPGVRQRSRAR